MTGRRGLIAGPTVLLLALIMAAHAALAEEHDDSEELSRIGEAIQKAENTAGILLLERQALTYAANTAQREGKALLLKLRTGKTVTFVDPTPCAGDDPPSHCEEHRLMGYYRSIRLFIVCVGHYEGVHYILVDDTSGDETRLPDFPSFSPSGDSLVSINDEGGFALEIWRRQRSRYVWQWGASPFASRGGTSYRVILWASEDKVDVEANQAEFIDSPAATVLFSLVKERGNWAIAGGP